MPNIRAADSLKRRGLRQTLPSFRLRFLGLLSTAVLSSIAPALNAQERPLSAIDWLSDSLDRPQTVALPSRPRPTATPSTTKDISENALPQTVTVSPLNAPNIDAVGLLSSAQTGFPSDLWGQSQALDLSRRITSLASQPNLLPASRRLLNRLILAELTPPLGLETQGRLFLARIDALLAQGLLEQANALLSRAGVFTPEVFMRAFDTKLLLGTENEACQYLQTAQGLSPSRAAQVFCLARTGDWTAAAITLKTAQTLNMMSDSDAELLTRFLDPELFEDTTDPTLPPPTRPSPLTFRLMEAIGQPISTQTLPLAFAQSDLRANAGWKARVTAAERLARVGAISANKWLGIWSEYLPAASGGIWDRLDALQKFDTSLKSGDPTAISRSFEQAWEHMTVAGLQTAFADAFAKPLSEATLTPDADRLAKDIALLSADYEGIAATWEDETGAAETQTDDALEFLQAIALGDISVNGQTGTPVTPTRARTPLEHAIQAGFSATGHPVRLATLIEDKRLGEAILRAIELLEGGAAGDLDELADALQFMCAVGLEETARRAALEILLLDKRG